MLAPLSESQVIVFVRNGTFSRLSFGNSIDHTNQVRVDRLRQRYCLSDIFNLLLNLLVGHDFRSSKKYMGVLSSVGEALLVVTG